MDRTDDRSREAYKIQVSSCESVFHLIYICNNVASIKSNKLKCNIIANKR